MKERIFFPIKVALIVLAFGIVVICVIPIKSNAVTHLVLMPVEKRLRNKIEFSSSTVWLPGGVSLEDMSVIDEGGRLYYCKAADIKYNLPNLLFKKGEIRINLKEVKFYRNFGLFDSVTDMLAISKMPDVEFEEIDGTLQLRKDAVYLKDLYAYNDLMRIRGNGRVDRDGLLDCEATFSFYKNITDKIPDVIKKTLLAKEDEGWMGISFKAHGNYRKPSLHLISNRLELNIMEGLFGDE